MWHFCVIQVKSQDKLKLTSYNFSNKHLVLTEEASEISIRTLKAVISGSISIVQNYFRILFNSEKMKLHCQENTDNTEQTDSVMFPKLGLGFLKPQDELTVSFYCTDLHGDLEKKEDK